MLVVSNYNVSGVNVTSTIDTTVTYTLILDRVIPPDISHSEFRLTLKPNPIFNGMTYVPHHTIIIGQDSDNLKISVRVMDRIDIFNILFVFREQTLTL